MYRVAASNSSAIFSFLGVAIDVSADLKVLRYEVGSRGFFDLHCGHVLIIEFPQLVLEGFRNIGCGPYFTPC